jgi:hypothetical protein
MKTKTDDLNKTFELMGIIQKDFFTGADKLDEKSAIFRTRVFDEHQLVATITVSLRSLTPQRTVAIF